MKFSVVIPTMWRSEYIQELLKRYEECELVSEIILIDNDTNNTPSWFEPNTYQKLRLYPQNSNIFVNPAWNLGVDLSSNEMIVISNDDILFNPDNILGYIGSAGDWESVGMHKHNFKDKVKQDEPRLIDELSIGLGWGCLLFVKKSKWVPIPNELKIWFGDNWISRTTKTQTLLFPNSIITEMSTTVGSEPDKNPTVILDKKIWLQKYINKKNLKPEPLKTIVILGMHRSATSMTARALHKSGEVWMGHKLLMGLPDNPKGHFEHIPIVTLNDKILKRAGGSWNKPPTREKILEVGVEFVDEIRTVIRELEEGARVQGMGSVGFKDPRLCLTIELFVPFLSQPQYIVCYRDHMEVARSLLKRNKIQIEHGIQLSKEYRSRVNNFILDI